MSNAKQRRKAQRRYNQIMHRTKPFVRMLSVAGYSYNLYFDSLQGRDSITIDQMTVSLDQYGDAIVARCCDNGSCPWCDTFDR